MRIRNWKKYNRQLIQRGSITFLVDPKVFKVKKKKVMGRPQLFSDSLITMLMITKIHHRLPYRSLQGFAESLVKLSRNTFQLPHYSCICKRARKLEPLKLSKKRPSVIAIDASGVKVYGEGEWKVKIHGQSKRRKWLKIHIAVDPNSGEIIAETTTVSKTHDSEALGPLLAKVPRSAKELLADGAYDGQNSRKQIRDRGMQALIPPPKNARIRNKDPGRDDAVRIIRGLGRSLWGKLTGYSQRSLAETVFSRIKRLFGARLFSKRFDAQRVENHLRCLILNAFTRGETNSFGDFVAS